jgi:hypothetical protein
MEHQEEGEEEMSNHSDGDRNSSPMEKATINSQDKEE